MLTYDALVREEEDRVKRGLVAAWAVWGMLALRSAVPLAVQVATAIAVVGVTGDPWGAAWRVAADFWLVGITIANVCCLLGMRWLLRREGLGLREIYNLERPNRRTLAWFGVGFFVSGPLAMVPNLVLAGWLFGDPQATIDLAFRPLPALAAWLLLAVFPITQGLAELPTYFGYVMPRLDALHHRAWWAAWLPALTLAGQHVFLPFLVDARYLVWRALMFLPFALWLAFLLRRRPGVMPWFVAGHVLMDASLPFMMLPR